MTIVYCVLSFLCGVLVHHRDYRRLNRLNKSGYNYRVQADRMMEGYDE